MTNAKFSDKQSSLLASVLVAVLALASGNSAIACDGASHSSDCLTKSHYQTMAECNKALATNGDNFHALVDRAVLETKLGLNDVAAKDLDHASVVLDKKAVSKAGSK